MPEAFDLKKIKGLSEKEAAERLKAAGPNELPSSKSRNVLSLAIEIVQEPMFLLLVACGSLYLVLGDVQEAVMLLGFVFVVMGITIYQERKTERALEALRDLSSPRALVIRGAEQKRIAGREVVPGDIIVLSEGDRVPADAVILNSINMSVNESLLTGESVPVSKASWDGAMEMGRPGGDDLPFVYSGTLVVSGRGVTEVRFTGQKTEMGKIGKALQTITTEETLLQKETGKIVTSLAAIGIALCAIVVVAYGLTRGHWTQGFLAGLTLAMATLPEEFPVVLTIFLALGAWRISQKRVLTRHMPAIETLGAATVLCVDKTGTITQNRMSVQRIYANGKYHDAKPSDMRRLPENFHEAVEYAVLASHRDPFDPMEQALESMGDTALSDTEHIHKDWTLVQEYPLSKELLAMSRVWKSPDGKEYVIAAKGAPEAMMDLCHMGGKEKKELSEHIVLMAEEGLRIIGIAKSSFILKDLPENQHDFKFDFIGLVGLADPIRPTVPASIQECYNAGIRVVMITGDYPGTAKNIANQIGLKNPENIITGSQLDEMEDKDLKEKIKTANVFARVVPEQKFRIVEALKANGEIVAMTGDGVNDAPALKSAHIGIAMGGRGTDVARESSDIVLLDDDFSSIVQAIRMGRRIYDNLKKAMAYILAVHVPIAGMSLIPVLFNWPLVLLPMHIVFLELIIDPACSVVFEAEAEEASVMKRPPRNHKKPMFNRRTIGISLLQGASVLAIVLAVYMIDMYLGRGENEARALAFTTMVVANIGLILTNRSWSSTIISTMRRPNPAVWWVIGGATFFLGLVLYVPLLRGLFKFATLHPMDLAVSLAAGIMSIMWFEIIKMARIHLK